MRGGGSSSQCPPNLARACPSLKKLFESRSTLPATVCKVATLHLKSKSFKIVFADNGFYRENSETDKHRIERIVLLGAETVENQSGDP